jgi:hypothetical protein
LIEFQLLKIVLREFLEAEIRNEMRYLELDEPYLPKFAQHEGYLFEQEYEPLYRFEPNTGLLLLQHLHLKPSLQQDF